MSKLILMPRGEAPGAQSRYMPDCPNWVFVVVHEQELLIENWCGRYFEWLDNHEDDIVELLGDADCSDVSDGLYIIEGHVDCSCSSTANDEHKTVWYFDRMRALTPAEWQRYREGEGIWDPEHFDPAFVEHAVDVTASDLQTLLATGKEWLNWRRAIEIDLSEAEIPFVQALLTLMDGSDGLPNVSG